MVIFQQTFIQISKLIETIQQNICIILKAAEKHLKYYFYQKPNLLLKKIH